MLSLRNVSTPPNQTGASLTGISFEIKKGEIAAVIGPNGSGKSLLGRVIADPDINFSGEITVNSFSSRVEPEKVKLQIGYVCPETPLANHLTGFEYLELIGAFYYLSAAVRAKRIVDLAQQFNCQEDLYRLIERLGAAGRQKIQLIASLLANPPLLVWDEPVALLDATVRQTVLGELEARVKAGGGALIITNDLDLAETVADQLVVLKAGHIIASGSLAELKNQTHQTNLAAAFSRLTRHD